MIAKGKEIAPATGKLGVVLPGMGAISSTFIAGVEAIKKGIAKPIGSLTQMGTIRLGKRTEGRIPKIKDFVPLASLDRARRAVASALARDLGLGETLTRANTSVLDSGKRSDVVF